MKKASWIHHICRRGTYCWKCHANEPSNRPGFTVGQLRRQGDINLILIGAFLILYVSALYFWSHNI